MTSAGGVLVALGTFTLCLDAYAMRKVFASSHYSQAQQFTQAALILWAPVVGAYLALYMAREDVPMFQKQPVEHVSDIDPTCSNFDYHG
jgi:hypothetical protein